MKSVLKFIQLNRRDILKLLWLMLSGITFLSIGIYGIVMGIFYIVVSHGTLGYIEAYNTTYSIVASVLVFALGCKALLQLATCKLEEKDINS